MIIKNRNLAVTILFCAIVIYVVWNHENFDGSASRRIPVNQLYTGYWDGFTSSGHIMVGNRGELVNNDFNWLLSEPKYVRPSGGEGFILRGPWVTLPPGHYEVRYFVDVLEGNTEDVMLILDIYARGWERFARTDINLYDTDIGLHEFSLFFYLYEDTEHMEWRAWVLEGAALRLTETIIYKLES